MPELVSLRNKSPRAKSVVYSGSQISIPGNSRGDFDKSIANRFLDSHPGIVIKAEDIGSVYEAELPAHEMMWIANMTGNPDVPDTVEGERYYDKTKSVWQPSHAENPCKRPVSVQRMYDPGQKEYTEKDGSLGGLNLASVLVEIPPYTRRQFPKDIGSWMMMRDGTAGKEFRGRIIKSRPPSSFEPDMSWPLDDMRTYLRLCDAEVNIGPSEKQVRNKNKGHDTELEIDKAKRDVWIRLYFCLVDPSVRLPTRSEFNEYVEHQEGKKEQAG